MSNRFNLFSLLCVFLFYQPLQQCVLADLYSPADEVIRLNSTTFIPTVFHRNKNITYVVQFYNSYCGHCHQFAPVYKDLASRVKNWTSVMRIAGIDCSNDENVITCSENKIVGYPTILIFPPNARVQDPKDAPLDLRSLRIEWTVDDIEESIINYITNLTSTHRELPLVVNALQPVKVGSIKEFRRIYPKSVDNEDTVVENSPHPHHELQDLMFLVESDKSYLGRKLIIEYFRISSKLELRRILLSNKALLRDLMPEAEFLKLDENQPILLRLNEGEGKARVLVRGEEKHILPTSLEHERLDFIHGRFKMFFEHFYSIELKESDVDSDYKPSSQVNRNQKSHTINNSDDFDLRSNEELEILHKDPVFGKKVFAMDLLKGISYMITHEIKIKGSLNPSEFNTVRNLLTIFKKYLPLEKWDSGLSKFIVDLRTHLDSNRNNYEKNGISAQEMRDLLDLSGADAIRLRYNRENWVSCFKSDKQHKGYTCSLWLLFHSLTVGEYYKAAPARIKPTMVLFTMRDYVTEFLGCTVCSSNYKKESESLNSSLNSRNSSVLWLWYTHNHISQRLNNERQSSDKLKLINVIFPSHERCEQCYKSTISEIGLDGKNLENIEWNMEHVLGYMTNTYQPDKIVSPVDMAAILSDLRGKVKYDFIDGNGFSEGSRRISPAGADLNRSVEQWNIFSTSDISLCLVLYLACIVMVAVVCVALNPKWRRFKTK